MTVGVPILQSSTSVATTVSAGVSRIEMKLCLLFNNLSDEQHRLDKNIPFATLLGVGRCCRDNASRKVCKHSWRPGQKKGSTTINTDHRYMGIRFYFEADREIWMPKFKKQ